MNRHRTDAQRPLVMPARGGPAADSSDWAGLIAAVAARGDRAAFAELFEHFAPRVKTFMLRSGMSDEAAEDLSQETLLMIWRKAALFDPESGRPANWIFTIARNLRLDALRRERRGAAYKISDIDAEFILDDSPGPDALVTAKRLNARVTAAIAELPQDQKRVVELSFYREEAHSEIAEMLQIPLGTVKSRLRLALGKLRRLLDDVS